MKHILHHLNLWQYVRLIMERANLTILSREHDGNRAERSLAFGVVGSHFHIKWRERWNALIAVHVARLCRRWDDGVRPIDLPQRPEGDDVAETVSVLKFFRHRLRGKHETIVILKHTDQIRPRVDTQCHSKSLPDPVKRHSLIPNLKWTPSREWRAQMENRLGFDLGNKHPHSIPFN